MGFGALAGFFKSTAKKTFDWVSPGGEIRTERFRNTRSAVIEAVEPAVVAGAISAQQAAFAGPGMGGGGGGGGSLGGPPGGFSGLGGLGGSGESSPAPEVCSSSGAAQASGRHTLSSRR